MASHGQSQQPGRPRRPAIKPPKIQRAMTHYNLYVRQEMANIKGVNKKNLFQHLRQIAEKWKTVSPAEKAQLDKAVQGDRERYQAEKAERDRNIVKRPCNAYANFIGDYSRNNHHKFKNISQCMVEGARIWRSMGARELAPWLKLAEDQKTTHAAQVEALARQQQQQAAATAAANPTSVGGTRKRKASSGRVDGAKKRRLSTGTVKTRTSGGKSKASRPRKVPGTKAKAHTAGKAKSTARRSSKK